ncbi:hypothetical protein M2263_001451 [Providencia alcalifaciens]|nr:hypothetical protein [Providencia alcalifaciens]
MNRYLLSGIGYGSLLFCLMVTQSQAVMIQAIAKDSKAVHQEETVGFYPRKFTINFMPENGGSFDPNCLTVQGQAGVYASGYGKVKIAGWGGHSMNYTTYGNYGYDLTITNL